MKTIVPLVVVIALTGCSLQTHLEAASATPSPPVPTPTLTLEPRPTSAPGTKDNPFILALSPAARTEPAALEASEVLTGLLGRFTGYTVVAVAPRSEIELLDALAVGNAHIGVLTPFAYVLVHEQRTASAAMASVRDSKTFYGAQFIASRTSRFERFFDEELGQNTEPAEKALAQFRRRKPCWSEQDSAAGHVVPLGLLNRARAFPREGAFLEGHPSVVRAVYAEGICDFGATFIDARVSPGLEADYPDVLERVEVIWRVPEVIPYEILVFSSDVPLEARRVLLRAFTDVMLDAQGKAAIQTIYGIEALQPSDDNIYAEFVALTEAADLELITLLDSNSQ